jgi:hypothetical protein
MKRTVSKITAFAFVALLSFPVHAASGAATPGTIQALIAQIGAIIASLIPIAFGAGLLAFFWGLAKYIFSAGSEDSKGEGKQIMIWGVIALFVMSSVFGLVELLRKTAGVGDEKTIVIPSL